MKYFVLLIFTLFSYNTYAGSFLQPKSSINIDSRSKEILGLNSSNQISILFFGYTECTDICPMTLHHTSKVIDLLDARGISLSGIFISIDPQRDSEEKLSKYFDTFKNKFRYVRANIEDMTYLKERFGVETVDFNKFEGNDNYVIDHSGTSFLISGEDQIAAMIDLSGMNTDVEEIVNKIAQSI